MHISPINFTGKAEINKYAKQYGPLTSQEQKIKDMCIQSWDNIDMKHVVSKMDMHRCFNNYIQLYKDIMQTDLTSS